MTAAIHHHCRCRTARTMHAVFAPHASHIGPSARVATTPPPLQTTLPVGTSRHHPCTPCRHPTLRALWGQAATQPYVPSHRRTPPVGIGRDACETSWHPHRLGPKRSLPLPMYGAKRNPRQAALVVSCAPDVYPSTIGNSHRHVLQCLVDLFGELDSGARWISDP